MIFQYFNYIWRIVGQSVPVQLSTAGQCKFEVCEGMLSG